MVAYLLRTKTTNSLRRRVCLKCPSRLARASCCALCKQYPPFPHCWRLHCSQRRNATSRFCISPSPGPGHRPLQYPADSLSRHYERSAPGSDTVEVHAVLTLLFMRLSKSLARGSFMLLSIRSTADSSALSMVPFENATCGLSLMALFAKPAYESLSNFEPPPLTEPSWGSLSSSAIATGSSR